MEGESWHIKFIGHNLRHLEAYPVGISVYNLVRKFSLRQHVVESNASRPTTMWSPKLLSWQPRPKISWRQQTPFHRLLEAPQLECWVQYSPTWSSILSKHRMRLWCIRKLTRVHCSDLPVLFPYPRIYPGKNARPVTMNVWNTNIEIGRAICVSLLLPENLLCSIANYLRWSYMCDLKSKLGSGFNWLPANLDRNAWCERALCTGDAFGDRKNRVTPIAHRSISTILPRAPETNILFTWVGHQNRSHSII